MSLKKTITLVVIARNESEGIKEIIPLIDTTCLDEFFAIDGNSSDDTVALLEGFGYKTYPQKNKGLGAAMLEARDYVKTDAFIFYHPDGNEQPEDIPKVVEYLQKHEFVVASRMIKGAHNEEDGQFLKLRKWANQGFALIANILFSKNGNKTSDVTNGFRGITCEAFDKMELDTHDLTMDYLMVIRALKKDIKIFEFPTYEAERIGGESNFASIPTGLMELKMLWNEFLNKKK
jgi:glycosyltransferase involved in cell wall biosynthesis